MASTCCFINSYDSVEIIDSACFSGFTPRNKKGQFIVVYLEKSPFSRKEMQRWFLHLRKMGFDFEYHFDKYRKAYMLNTIEISKVGDKYRTLFCMLVRFLWEGHYKVIPGYYNDDFFIEVIPIYYALYDYKKKHNKNELLCMACSIWSMGNNNYNSNHFPCYKGGSFIRKNWKKIGKKGLNINSYFGNEHKALFDYAIGDIDNKNVTREEIIKIYKWYEQHKEAYYI